MMLYIGTRLGGWLSGFAQPDREFLSLSLKANFVKMFFELQFLFNKFEIVNKTQQIQN